MSAVEFDRMLLDNREFLQPFAFSLTRDSESAKDLLQETIYRALANREKYNSGTNIKAWLYTIMRNIFINNYRRKNRQLVVLDPSPNDLLINQGQSAAGNNVEMLMNIKELQGAIYELPGIFKKPFQLYCDGYKYQEIAAALREPLGTIKSRIHFARKLLKTQIERN
jgi:RNA polymerase sigma-70 factor (ECF subfamily)